jgi:ribosomal protein S18 acetylase RimI-like enzyme
MSASRVGRGTNLAQSHIMQTPGHNGSDITPPPRQGKATPCVRWATWGDISAIVQLHVISLPQFPLRDPCPAFLRNFYSFLLHDRQGFLLVSQYDRQLAGFVAGFSDPVHLYERFGSNRLRNFASVSACLVRHPIQLPKFVIDLRRALRFKYELGDCSEPACELLTVAIQPRLRRQGHGKALIQALAAAAHRNKIVQVRVCLGSSDGGMAAFYRRLGFTPLRRIQAFDTMWSHEYVLAFKGNGEVN